MNYGSLAECSSSGYVRAEGDYCGGFVARSSESIEACYSNCGVMGRDYVGGFAGSAGEMVDCYSMGTVSGRSYVGGFAGNTAGNRYCYSTCVVHGNGIIVEQHSRGGGPSKYIDYFVYVGGFAGTGWYQDDNIGCFWDIEASRMTESNEGAGLLTAQMQTLQTYLDAGWDFVAESDNGEDDIWMICEGQDYPALRWEQTPCL